MIKYFESMNRRPFSAICQNGFGRQVITTNQTEINELNIVDELARALDVHNQNAIEIKYLDGYYRGNQPIRYRKKDVRPEINNKVVQNLAYMIVETKTAEIVGEPIQYVLRGTEEDKAEQIDKLNRIMDEEDKSHFDIDLKRWSSICGTAYRFVGRDNGNGNLVDGSPFYFTTENPVNTFVCYYSNGREAFSCQIREDVSGATLYNIYTDKMFFLIKDGEIIRKEQNGFGGIPVIEYPNNSRRLSDIEITIDITDSINKMASDRLNSIEGFVSSWIKFINCEVDEESFLAMRQEGALVVKSNNGENKADVDVMTTELNQTQSQVAVSDQYEKLLVIQGLANRQNSASGDTQGAVELRNGHYDAEKRAELYEPIFKRAERKTLRLMLNALRIENDFNLVASDIDIHITRTKMDNMQVKAQVLQMLLASGIEESIAIKTVGLFSDAQGTAIASKKRMDILYPKEVTEEIKAETDV